MSARPARTPRSQPFRTPREPLRLVLPPKLALAQNAATRAAHPLEIRTMGTYGRVTIVADSAERVRAQAEQAFAVFRHVDRLMSNWTDTSEIARIHREAAQGAVRIDAEVARVLAVALDVWTASEGAFDVTIEPLVRTWGFLGGKRRVPSAEEITAARARIGAERLSLDLAHCELRFADPATRIDLGGIAKGYAVDRAAETLRAAGVTDALVDLSGNMRALGAPAAAPEWRIGIRDPHGPLVHIARILLPNGHGISTSAQYEQFIVHGGVKHGHVMDPRTGEAVTGFASVTTVAPDALTAECWSTALLVLGPKHAKRVARNVKGLSYVAIEPGADGVDTIWVSEGLRDRVALTDAASRKYRIEVVA